MIRKNLPRVALLFVCLGVLRWMPAAEPAAEWHGYPRENFTFEGLPATVIAPHRIAEGRPWMWKARFLDHRPDLDLALLELGFHIVALDDTREMLGSPECIAIYAKFHDHVTTKFGLSKKAAMEGVSRGGLYIFNFAAAHPDRVACLYADAAVCDFRSWPAGKPVFGQFSGKGGGKSWEMMKKSYGFASDDEARAWTKNPVDNLKPLADAKIPLFHVVGADDDVVPVAENTALIEKRYRELGGSITVVSKPGEKHAHGLADVAPVVDFIVRNTCGRESTRPILHNVRRIVFLGDSITHGGRYIEYVASYLYTRHPDRRFEIINLGLASETTSGLSEEGHADGKFPRPCVHERLDRALAETRPDLVVACYGINDGIYKPLDEQRFNAFREGMTKLAGKVKAAGAQLLVLTPPVFDSLPIKARTTPDGVGKPFVDYDSVMGEYSRWLLNQKGQSGWNVHDIHGPMLAHINQRRLKQPDFTFSKDGVHPGPAGHWMMAQPILAAWGACREVDLAQVEGAYRVSRGNVTELKQTSDGLSFTWTTRLPMPMDPQWEPEFLAIQRVAAQYNVQRLSVSGLAGKEYQLFEDDKPIGQFTRQQLAAGLDVLALEKLSINQSAPELRKLIGQQLKMVGDAWRSHVGHNRPGVAKGLPLEEAKTKSAEIEARIRELCAPKSLKLRLAEPK